MTLASTDLFLVTSINTVILDDEMNLNGTFTWTDLALPDHISVNRTVSSVIVSPFLDDFLPDAVKLFRKGGRRKGK